MLTERENDVLELIILGYTNNEIADALTITIHTVKAHISSILTKFGAKSRTQLPLMAFRQNLINPNSDK